MIVKSSLPQFPAGARVCCFGDSITHNGTWMGAMFEQYRLLQPEKQVRFYNCGISGGGMHTILDHLERDLAAYRPTHAVILCGVNDMLREMYEPGCPLDVRRMLRTRMRAIQEYGLNLLDILTRLTGAGVRVLLLPPLPYDETQESPTPLLPDCESTVRIMGQLCRQAAGAFGCDFLEVHDPMQRLAGENRDIPLIQPDRIHPTPVGQMLLARMLLHAQGFDGMLAGSVRETLTAPPLPLSALNRRRMETENTLQTLDAIDLMVFLPMGALPLERKIEIADHYVHGGMPDYGVNQAYFEGALALYAEKAAHREELLQEYLRLTEEMAV